MDQVLRRTEGNEKVPINKSAGNLFMQKTARKGLEVGARNVSILDIPCKWKHNNI